jgi:hypothetical protein
LDGSRSPANDLEKRPPTYNGVERGAIGAASTAWKVAK